MEKVIITPKNVFLKNIKEGIKKAELHADFKSGEKLKDFYSRKVTKNTTQPVF